MDRIEVKFSTENMDAKTGEFSGYGAVFGNVDSHGDVIVPGAFKASLDAWGLRGRFPSMKLMHGSNGNPFNGDDLPVGKWIEMREDSRGLFVKGQLSALDTDRGRLIHALMRDGVLDGLSIGYRAKQASRLSGGAKRQLEVVDLSEVSIVDNPSNDLARTSEVKSADQIKTIRDFEDFLRDAGGFSNAAAKAIASCGFKAADPRDEDGADLVAMLRRNIATLS